MALIVGDPALRRLAVLKLRGGLRRQLQRVRTPSGLIFMLVGAGLSIAWLGSLMMGRDVFQDEAPDPQALVRWTQLGMLVFGLISGLTTLSVRGVYLPKNEIERLFAAPVKRSDLVRYRMLVDLGRTIFGALVLGLLVFRRMPVPLFGFLGAVLAVLTLGVVRQAASILLADVGSRVGEFFKGKRLIPLRILLGILVWFLIMSMFVGERFTDRIFGKLSLLGDQGFLGDPSALLEHPVLGFLLAPFAPWAKMMAAVDSAEFMRWGALCSVLLVVFFELTARLRIDFREASLETSADISVRLKRLRRGGPLSTGEVSQSAAARRVPWIFGRGPMGAVAWIKTASILRKARGTILIGLAIVSVVTIGVTVLMQRARGGGEAEVAVASAGLIALLGVMYLSGALRFDFRSDIDRMVQIKSWPISPTRVFIATLLPQVLLISGALGSAILIRSAITGSFHPAELLVIAALPFVEFAWLAVDNAVYLFAPVRFVPGQEGSLHHTGRAIVLFLLRGALTLITLALIAAPAAVIFGVGPQHLGLSVPLAVVIASSLGACVLLGMVGLLAWVGGRMLRRFDVARDRV